MNKLEQPLKIKNVDGTLNKTGTVRFFVTLKFTAGKEVFQEDFYVTGLGRQDIIIGHPWLVKHNPTIDWKTGKIFWVKKTSKEKNNKGTNKWKELETAIYHALVEKLEDELWINAKTSISHKLAQEEEEETKPEKPLEEMIPKEYHEYLDVFSKSKSERLPERKP